MVTRPKVFVVGVDGTHASDEAFDRTLKLASARDRVVVLHSFSAATRDAATTELTELAGACAPAVAVERAYRAKLHAKSLSPMHSVVVRERRPQQPVYDQTRLARERGGA